MPIGRRALDIISVLAHAQGEIVTKDELLGAVWPGVNVEENALQVHVVALRKALGPEADRLKTIRGVGYQLHIDADSDFAAGSAAPYPELAISDQPGLPEETEAAPAPANTGDADFLRPSAQRTGGSNLLRFIRPGTGILAVAVPALLMGAGALFGVLGPTAQDRVPVVVRQLAPSGGDRTETALASGITDELIVRLRQVPELRIATAEADGSVPSEAFRNAYVVDGTLRSSGDKLRVTARLLNEDGEVLWSQTFDRGKIELFDVQEEIASSIAGALSVSFDVGGNSADYGGTDNPEAYAAYMQYQAHILDTEFDGRPYLLRAVTLDPKYAKARAALDGDYGLQISLVPTMDKEKLLREMDRNTRTSLSANPDLWFPIAARGMFDVYRHDFVRADRRYRQVASLDKGIDPELRSKWANFEMLVGRVNKAVSLRSSNELIDPIQRNDPFRIYDLEMLGKHQDSIGLFRSLERKNQRGLGGFVFHAFMPLLLSGQESEAIRFTEEQGQSRFAEMWRAIKDEPELSTMSAAQLRTWAEKRYGKGAEFEFAHSGLYAAHLGHSKLAVEFMRLAFEGPSGGALWTLWHPAMAKARQTDEFENLVTKLGLVKMWRESSDWGDFCQPIGVQAIACN